MKKLYISPAISYVESFLVACCAPWVDCNVCDIMNCPLKHLS